MVKVRASTFILGSFAAAGKAEPMNKVGAKTMLVYSAGGMWWSKSPLIVKNAPHTIENPHEGQVDVRIKFGEIAKANKDKRGFEDGLPVVAAAIKRELDKFKSPNSMHPDAYPSKRQRTIHTLDDLRRIKEEMEARRMKAGIAWATRPP